MESTLVPLIGGAKTGPLGIAHLPRLWLKMRAYAVGALPEGYRHGNGGSDEDFLTTFGVDGDAFARYIASAAPDYQACEVWIRANAADTSPATIQAFNESLTSFEMPDPRRSEWSARFGLDGTTYTRAVALNQLDDWDGVHRQLLAFDPAPAPLVPAISSSLTGPLGVPHLPRLWLKHRLHGVGRLPEGYRHGAGGFDETLTSALGVDAVAFASYVETDKPDYLTAETWVREHATTLSPETLAALTTRFHETNLPAELGVKRRAELGITDASFERSIPLNDLDDWAALHRQLLAVAP
jgi:hypothetical protein